MAKKERDIDAEGKAKCILWTDRAVTIYKELSLAGIPPTLDWVRMVMVFAFPEEPAHNTEAIGFFGSDTDNVDEDE